MFQTKKNKIVHYTVSILPLRCDVDLFFDATLIWDGARIDLWVIFIGKKKPLNFKK